VTDKPTKWQTDQASDKTDQGTTNQPSDRQTNQVTDRPSKWQDGSRDNQPTKWQTDQATMWQTDLPYDVQSIEKLTNQQTKHQASIDLPAKFETKFCGTPVTVPCRPRVW